MTPKSIATSTAIGSESQKREARLEDQDRHRVGPNGHERRLAEVDDPGEADVELKAKRDERVGARDHADADPEVGSVRDSR